MNWKSKLNQRGQIKMIKVTNNNVPTCAFNLKNLQDFLNDMKLYKADFDRELGYDLDKSSMYFKTSENGMLVTIEGYYDFEITAQYVLVEGKYTDVVWYILTVYDLNDYEIISTNLGDLMSVYGKLTEFILQSGVDLGVYTEEEAWGGER